MNFKERLRYLRKARHLTQGEVAKILNYGYTAISNYESGRNQPSIDDLIRLARFFDVSVDYLIGATEVKRNFEGVNLNMKKVKWFLDIYETVPDEIQKTLKILVHKIYALYVNRLI